jgi:uncharacterized membrane protein YhaH (DUF805 family)
MDSWKSASRAQERRLWNTLLCVGIALTLVIALSIVVAVGGPDQSPSRWFLTQQAVLLALSTTGTVVAVRRWHGLR